MNQPNELAEQIADVRRFNRFYTRQIGLLSDRLLKSEFSLTEARVLFELAKRERPTSTALNRELGMDPGYLSRLLKKFESRNYLRREPSAADGRQSFLRMTPIGRTAAQALDRASHAEVAALLDRLTPSERARLVRAMNVMQRLLDDAPTPAEEFVLRPLQTGDVGWITHRMGLLYAQDYGWDRTYEALVAEILGGFVRNFDPEHEQSWIAEGDGGIVGSIFLVRESEERARLRLLYVDRPARGRGLGRRLVDACIGFARESGYRTLTLWTTDNLVSARRIYEAAGFVMVKEEPYQAFGKDLVSQHWDLTL